MISFTFLAIEPTIIFFLLQMLIIFFTAFLTLLSFQEGFNFSEVVKSYNPKYISEISLEKFEQMSCKDSKPDSPD